MNATIILSTIATAMLLFVMLALVSGTLLWLLYPTVHLLFPTATLSGVIAPTLSWWTSVKISWLLAVLKGAIHSTTSNRESK